ncbi:GNAT family N-acetyltransferase [uncultured Roseobacter sp.]|uniref:GNAT family N-acetyltransferase n=1 Tax=uncultured Roseobacter sp. TaxID=114847 RepID=UPI002607F3D0|nr:GNAT family N-acetyltransferase [uncultured Roseobacter sp.]
MTPDALAALHRAAFTTDRAWQAAEFSDLLSSAHTTLLHRPHGFALVRTIADEAELLTLAVQPDHHRQGIASALMHDWLSGTEATQVFLEVAADNVPARRLYERHGLTEHARRSGYYARPGAAAVDAVLMRAALPPRHMRQSPGKAGKTG